VSFNTGMMNLVIHQQLQSLLWHLLRHLVSLLDLINLTKILNLPIIATTVDVERVFSEGRNQINWNQKSMSSQAFRAQMCVGSWYSAPWFSMDLADISKKLQVYIDPYRLYRSYSHIE
jgi:hypothetical protein